MFSFTCIWVSRSSKVTFLLSMKGSCDPMSKVMSLVSGTPGSVAVKACCGSVTVALGISISA